MAEGDATDAAPKSTDAQRDSDGDGITDAKERAIGTNPNSSDTDGDGVSDADELFGTGSDPRKLDTDADGITDAREKALGTDAGKADTDGDGLSDWDELTVHHSDPTKADSDGDLLRDDKEVALELDPNKADTDQDGEVDGLQHWRAAGMTRAEMIEAMEARERGDKYEIKDGDRDGMSDALVDDVYRTDEHFEAMDKEAPRGELWLKLTEEVAFSGHLREVEKDAWLRARMRGETNLDADEWVDSQEKAGISWKYDESGDAVPEPVGQRSETTADGDTQPAAGSGTGTGTGTEAVGDAEPGATPADVFLREATNVRGTPFSRHSSADVNDHSPDSFDASELVKWAAGRAGVSLRDGSWRQYQQLQGMDQTDISVDDALQTPGALLFHFSRDPLGSPDRPSESHVAISLGDGRVIEATTGGVRVADAAGRFEYAATVPEFEGATLDSIDVDRDGLTDDRELQLGTDRFDHDSDDDMVFDGQEVDMGLDPKSPDTDGDGRQDWEELIETPTTSQPAENPGADATGAAVIDDVVGDAQVPTTEGASATAPVPATALDADSPAVVDPTSVDGASEPLPPDGGQPPELDPVAEEPVPMSDGTGVVAEVETPAPVEIEVVPEAPPVEVEPIPQADEAVETEPMDPGGDELL